MSLLGRIDSFLGYAETLDAAELRAWLPEISEWQRELEPLRGNTTATHALPERPDVERRILALRQCVGRANVLGVIDAETGEIVHRVLEFT